MNIAKKSTNDDSELSDKSTALGNTTFKITKTEYGQQSETKEVTTTDGEEVKSVFGDTNIKKDSIGADKPDVYVIDEVTTKNGYKKIDLSNISINVYKIKRAYFPKRIVCSLPIRLLLCLEIIIKSFEL